MAGDDTRRDWEIVQEDVGISKTEKLRILSGWLYRTTTTAGVALVFVPLTTTERAESGQ